jgi:hypothetical protein
VKAFEYLESQIAATTDVRPEHRGDGFLNLLSRDVAQVLCKAPAVPEGVGDLTVALAPENVLERLPYLRAGVDRAFPERIDVIRIQMQDGGGADAERRQHAQLGELVRQYHRRVPEPQLDLHEFSSRNLDATPLLGAEYLPVPIGGPSRVADDDVRRDRVHSRRRRHFRLSHTSTSS